MIKSYLSPGKAVACLILLCFFFISACKKDLLQPHSDSIGSNISISEAKKYFDSHISNLSRPKIKMSAGGTASYGQVLSMDEVLKNKQAVWDKAYETMISVGGAVKVPIDMGDTYTIVNRKTGAIVPFASLNYLLMYKDSLQSIHANWVYLEPDSSWFYGNRNQFTGKISVGEWSGKLLQIFNYPNPVISKKLTSSKIATITRTSQTIGADDPGNEPGGGNTTYVPSNCVRLRKSIADCTCIDKNRCDYWTCDACGTTVCDWGFPSPAGPNPPGPTNPATPPGTTPGGNSGNPMGGGVLSPSDVTPNCNAEPGYEKPTYPAPPGYQWVMPCSVPLPANPGNTLPGYNEPLPISDSEVFFDSESGTSVTFGEVRELFENNPGYVDELEAENDLPIITVPYYAVFKTQEIAQEYLALRYMYPNWSPPRAASTAMWNALKGDLHFFLDVAGMAPVIGEPIDLVNGAIYFIEGDKINGSLSVGAAIPIWGWTATGGKWIRNATKLVSKPIAEAAGKLAYRAIKTSRGGYRFVKVAVGAFSHSAITALKAIKPADKTLTNISRQLIDQMAHRIQPVAQSLKSKIDDIVLHADINGTKTEALCDELFETDGFIKYDSKFGSSNGFDGVFIKKDGAGNVEEILINEAKQVGTLGNIKLSGANPATSLKAQMSDAWISDGIAKMKLEGGNLGLLADLLNANRGKITKTVTGVERSSGEIIIVKLNNY